ncbi:MAG: glycosyltransferase family 39 protein [Methylicorpusculum sp.]|uniref:ArnT family glycosyltransferase n=1 Tax=Methylicorpusculum sp. TaxID=2713644 RepID=UPI00271B5600|nr:glycosyltransferase family 39 protein [Methylicorpusculum sp.]MDO8940838.1 glycosyltransferase family 39 protein [Methylicorpusculum sp.]MDP2204398.1 glycosyltransferase family 39 protein [Methylicorpusculum sp.]
MRSKLSSPIWLVLLWAALVSVSLINRPLFPIDETRYLAVAWEMWSRNDFLVPYLNGQPYSHKPPFLFWLMQLSWAVFGVNEWTPRLIAPAFALASVFLTVPFARLLWPQRPAIADSVPFILLGFWLWIVFSTLTMFDMLLAFFVLLGLYSLVKASLTHSFQYWLLLGLAVGGGILTKGPVILIHLLPVSLLAPWWAQKTEVNFNWRYWYFGVLAGLLTGALIALSWAIPAGFAGGEAYQKAIFLGQTTGRLVNSFAHAAPWWWYLAFLPLFLLPWLLWRPFWAGLISLKLDEKGVRFCIAWFLPVFITFSFVSGKQFHYLLPEIPALALLIARSADGVTLIKGRQFHHLLTGMAVLAGLIAVGLSNISDVLSWPEAAKSLLISWGGFLLISALILRFIVVHSIKHSAFLICLTSIVLLAVSSSAYFSLEHRQYDLEQPSKAIASLLAEGKPVVHYKKYHGEYNFYGRLTHGLPVVSDALKWSMQHPDGYIIIAHKRKKHVDSKGIVYQHAFKNKTKSIISADFLLKDTELQGLLK